MNPWNRLSSLCAITVSQLNLAPEVIVKLECCSKLICRKKWDTNAMNG